MVSPRRFNVKRSGASNAKRFYVECYRRARTAQRHIRDDGIVSYNVLLQENNTKKIFCLPSDLVLTVQQAEEIINHVANRLAKPDDVPISVLLVVGLQEAFPCS